MKSLNTSLPRSPRRQRSSQPPEQLIQSFKSAALSVTNLYKTAAADQKIARDTGYQDALDDLLVFLDKEHIGLDDGEGWRIRQWATERLDSGHPTLSTSDDEEDRAEVTNRARSSSPVVQRVAEQAQQRQPSRSTSPTQPAAAPAPRGAPAITPESVGIQAPTEQFTFRSACQYPQDVDMPSSDTTEVNRVSPSSQTQNMPAPAVRVELMPRGPRTSHKSFRSNTRSNTNVRLPSLVTNSKRRFPFPDYFDIGSLGDGKEGQGGGGKRGRFS